MTRLDRLARSTRDLLNLLATISERGASFRSLRDAWADTTNAHGRLIITVLAGLAEFERELIRSRCGEGIVRAKARGVRFGRPPKLTPHQGQEARARLEAGETQSDRHDPTMWTRRRLAGWPDVKIRPPGVQERRFGAIECFCRTPPMSARCGGGPRPADERHRLAGWWRDWVR